MLGKYSTTVLNLQTFGLVFWCSWSIWIFLEVDISINKVRIRTRIIALGDIDELCFNNKQIPNLTDLEWEYIICLSYKHCRSAMLLLYLFRLPRFGLKEHSFSKLFLILLQREKNIVLLTFGCLFKFAWITSWPKQVTQLILKTTWKVHIIFSCEKHCAPMTIIVFHDTKAEGKTWIWSLPPLSYKEEETTIHNLLHNLLAIIKVRDFFSSDTKCVCKNHRSVHRKLHLFFDFLVIPHTPLQCGNTEAGVYLYPFFLWKQKVEYGIHSEMC